jgi:hypothetical protein
MATSKSNSNPWIDFCKTKEEYKKLNLPSPSLAEISVMYKEHKEGKKLTTTSCAENTVETAKQTKEETTIDTKNEEKKKPPKMVKVNSEVVNIKTEIKEYTNKGGKTHLAHFTMNGKYLGPCSKLGNEPIFYEGWFDEELVNSVSKK